MTKAIINPDKSVFVIIEFRCSRGYCEEYGCDFPDCAHGETFDSIDQASAAFPDVEVIDDPQEQENV